MQVVLADVDYEEAKAAAERLVQKGMEAHAVKCDVRHKSDVDALITEVVSWGGRIDIMVANAGEKQPLCLCAPARSNSWDMTL